MRMQCLLLLVDSLSGPLVLASTAACAHTVSVQMMLIEQNRLLLLVQVLVLYGTSPVLQGWLTFEHHNKYVGCSATDS